MKTAEQTNKKNGVIALVTDSTESTGFASYEGVSHGPIVFGGSILGR